MVSVAPGLLLGWLWALEPGLVHWMDAVEIMPQVLVLAAGVGVMWLWVGYEERFSDWLDEWVELRQR